MFLVMYVFGVVYLLSWMAKLTFIKREEVRIDEERRTAGWAEGCQVP